MYILMLFETYFFDISRNPYIQWSDILVDECVIGYFIVDVAPEIVGGKPKSRSGKNNAYQVQDNVTQPVLFQYLLFLFPFTHDSIQLVRDGHKPSEVDNKYK